MISRFDYSKAMTYSAKQRNWQQSLHFSIENRKFKAFSSSTPMHESWLFFHLPVSIFWTLSPSRKSVAEKYKKPKGNKTRKLLFFLISFPFISPKFFLIFIYISIYQEKWKSAKEGLYSMKHSPNIQHAWPHICQTQNEKHRKQLNNKTKEWKRPKEEVKVSSFCFRFCSHIHTVHHGF